MKTMFPLKFRVHGKSENFQASMTVESADGFRLLGLGRTASMSQSLFVARCNFVAMLVSIANITYVANKNPQISGEELGVQLTNAIKTFGGNTVKYLREAGEFDKKFGKGKSPVAKKRKRVAPSKTSKKTKKPTKTKGSK